MNNKIGVIVSVITAVVVVAVLGGLLLSFLRNTNREAPSEKSFNVREQAVQDRRTPEQIDNEKWCAEEEAKGNKVCKG